MVQNSQGDGAQSVTLDEIIDDRSMREEEFPVTSKCIYLAHAAVSPLPGRTADAIATFAHTVCRSGQFERYHCKAEHRARVLLAELLGASHEEIAFAPSTSAGISMVASGLNLRAGDNVVAVREDFPSNILPWRALVPRGVELRLMAAGPSGVVDLLTLKRWIDGNTKLVALSTAHYVTGHLTPISEISTYLNRRGILLCVDAIQTLGLVPCSVANVDFLVADAHKWLLGPSGVAVLYVNRRSIDRLAPVLVGWKTFESPGVGVDQRLRPSAARFEPGTLNALGIVGLEASAGLLVQFTTRKVAERVGMLTQRLTEGLLSLGLEIVGCRDSTTATTGIVSCSARAGRPLDIVRTAERLADATIIVSMRAAPNGAPCLRIAPHCYNTKDDVDACLSVLKRAP